jgi:uncharacterized cupin superfamily protein
MCAGFRAGSGDGHHLHNDLQAVMGTDGKWRFTREDGTAY